MQSGCGVYMHGECLQEECILLSLAKRNKEPLIRVLWVSDMHVLWTLYGFSVG